ncbi:hypothetical protein ANN_27878 [Periplaneta americana]|uniref:DDE-1 domain-containing protein n=1 Tax=Periplaneta americana TaxID=6978 RepID=A0ABQ8RVD1_PERAM|nr:hypothetical protein ANN_27878 [Periplaneta americana]
MDNHECHISVQALDYAKSKGISLLTLPPHCSNRLQSIDVSVFGPFKRYFNSAADGWMLSNPGKTISIYQISSLSDQAFTLAFTPKNIQAGFKKTGIYLFNRDISVDDDFLCSFVTDRPDPNNACVDNSVAQSCPQDDVANICLTPEQLRPYPKAQPRKKKGGRTPGRSRILTDTPEKLQIEENEAKRKAPTSKCKKTKVARRLVVESDDFNVDDCIISSGESE